MILEDLKLGSRRSKLAPLSFRQFGMWKHGYERNVASASLSLSLSDLEICWFISLVKWESLHNLENFAGRMAEWNPFQCLLRCNREYADNTCPQEVEDSYSDRVFFLPLQICHGTDCRSFQQKHVTSSPSRALICTRTAFDTSQRLFWTYSL